MAYDSDEILEELGRFGKYQAITYTLITVPIIFHVITGLSYVFTVANNDHRCYIPGCEADARGAELLPAWLPNAVPYEQRASGWQPARCLAYRRAARANKAPADGGVRVTIRASDAAASKADSQCPAAGFTNETVRCSRWVYDVPDSTIAAEWGIACDEEQWKLTLVGTLNSLGYFVTTPLAGYLSDRFGRKTIMLYSIGLSALVGIARSFSPNYEVFLAMEFFDMLFGGSVYETAYVLGIEQVGPSARVLANTILGAVDVIGEVLLGFLAWLLQDWRMLLRVAYLPGFIILSCYWWILPESVRWLLVNGRANDASAIVQKAAKQNGVKLSEKALKKLKLFKDNEEKCGKDVHHDKAKPGLVEAVKMVFKSTPLQARLLVCCFCWGSNMFVFYGLSLYSVAMAGNRYVNYMLVSLIELPGCLAAYFALDRLGRRTTLCASFLLAAAACLMFTVIPTELQEIRFFFYLIGKFGITISYSAIHIFATELFPTQLRHLMMGTCTMVGGAGEMLAPQSPLLATYAEWLPVGIFGAMAFASGVLSLTFPETKNTRLPDTVHEAEIIGQPAPNRMV